MLLASRYKGPSLLMHARNHCRMIKAKSRGAARDHDRWVQRQWQPPQAASLLRCLAGAGPANHYVIMC